MKCSIILAFLAFSFLQCPVYGAKCPRGQVWRKGPTFMCDTSICRGAAPYCDDPAVLIFACRCKNSALRMDGGKCVTICPEYPAPPPPADY